MSARSLSLQDHFLNAIRRAKLPVTIFLVKGVKLQGVVTWFDAFSLLLRRDGTSQLVYVSEGGHLAAYENPRTLRDLTADELLEVMQDPEVQRAQLLRRLTG